MFENDFILWYNLSANRDNGMALVAMSDIKNIHFKIFIYSIAISIPLNGLF